MNASALVTRSNIRTFAAAVPEVRTSTVRVIDANDPGSVLADVAPGMQVIGASLSRLGTVARVIASDAGTPIAVTVAYGIRGRRRKYVPGEFVDLVDDDRVVLSIDQNEFKALQEIAE
ncbi:MAG TPA: hypothetical protein VF201_01970 [Nitrolancea sp.]